MHSFLLKLQLKAIIEATSIRYFCVKRRAFSFYEITFIVLHFYSIKYEKQVIIWYFNLTPDNKSMREFVDL